MKNKTIITTDGHDLRFARNPSSYFVVYNDTNQTKKAIAYLNKKLKLSDDWRYARDLLVKKPIEDYFICRNCHKKIKCSIIENGRTECDICKDKREDKYLKERKNLVGKMIVKVEANLGKPLTLYLGDGTKIIIADGEYGDDCSEITK
jgi:hypothetical protein